MDNQTNKQSDQALIIAYKESIKRGEINADPQQALIIQALQSIYNDLLANCPETKTHKKSTFERLLAFASGDSYSGNSSREKDNTENNIKGLYIWGGVGTGKTHMMDFFFKHLPIEHKMRFHFHRFMQLVHDALNDQAHIKNPLKAVAEKFAQDARILCLDEMHINDITDAMILSKLFSHLFGLGVTLVTTSNVSPTNLYKDGLQRSQFLPMIALLEEKTTVIHLDSNIDYRLQLLEKVDVYQDITTTCTKELANEKMEAYFNALVAINRHKKRKHVIINKRKVPVIKWTDGIAWFSFETLCETNRSTDDYIQLGRFFHTIMISDIPIMTSMQNDAARRFVNMIDEFYDRHVNLIVSAEAPPETLYIGTRLAFEFERTASRLIEMQSKEYFMKKRGVT